MKTFLPLKTFLPSLTCFPNLGKEFVIQEQIHILVKKMNQTKPQLCQCLCFFLICITLLLVKSGPNQKAEIQ